MMDTLRSRCGRARLTLHPEWDAARPWVSYIDGTAGMHYATADAGVAALSRRGFRFDKPPAAPGLSDLASDTLSQLRELGPG